MSSSRKERAEKLVQFGQSQGAIQQGKESAEYMQSFMNMSNDQFETAYSEITRLTSFVCALTGQYPTAPVAPPNSVCSCCRFIRNDSGTTHLYLCGRCRKPACTRDLFHTDRATPILCKADTAPPPSVWCRACINPRLTEATCGVCDAQEDLSATFCGCCGRGMCKKHKVSSHWCTACDAAYNVAKLEALDIDGDDDDDDGDGKNNSASSLNEMNEMMKAGRARIEALPGHQLSSHSEKQLNEMGLYRVDNWSGLASEYFTYQNKGSLTFSSNSNTSHPRVMTELQTRVHIIEMDPSRRTSWSNLLYSMMPGETVTVFGKDVSYDFLKNTIFSNYGDWNLETLNSAVVQQYFGAKF